MLNLRDFYQLLTEQKWLDGIADVVQPAVKSAFEGLGPTGRPVKNALNGTWLGHPLHPVLTDIPIGAWTVTVLLDSMDNGNRGVARGLRRAADASLLLGLAGAAGAAVTGLTDWSDTDARPRRTGMAHALLNVGATLLFTGSFFSRRRGNRTAGKALALAGFAIASASAYIGGELVSHEQIGVDHSAAKPYPDKYTAVLDDDALKEGKPKRADFEGTPILLVRLNGKIHALAETCAHLGGPLSEGKIESGCIVCPWHGSTFDLSTGEVFSGPSAFPQPSMPTRVRSGKIEIGPTREPQK
ncbi:MAG: Rieske 2Fe-2S domain-containing protein [Acidobacteriota bacterium]|nr:Rieske 2Fe-2S domain-containing protein [Acidobacteriota bacterium]